MSAFGQTGHWSRHGRRAAFDPTETWAAQNFRTAKALFVFSQSVISSPPLHGMTPTGGSHGNLHPTARIHIHVPPQFGSRVAARGAGAAAGYASDRVPWFHRAELAPVERVPPRPRRSRLR